MNRQLCENCTYNYGLGKTTEDYIAHCYLLYEEKKIAELKKGDIIGTNLLKASQIRIMSDIPSGCPYQLEHILG